LLVTLITAQSSLAEGRSLAKSVTPAQPDITLAKAVLGWEPKVQLEAGLKKTIEYFAQSL
jgi:nucleoside-diphosphate-sugar epimerase